MSYTPVSIDVLQERIGYQFSRLDLLNMALTHASTGSEHNYERLEFLGDRVLGLSVAELLYERFPSESEGDLAKRLSALVQGSLLAKIANTLDLGDFIRLSDGERDSGGAQNEHILADVFESVLGAMYLDGGLEPCQRWIKSVFRDDMFTMTEPPQHPKTAVQEWAQGRSLGLPSYEVVSQSGPDHAPIFNVALNVEGFDLVHATGKSRQEAEKRAAALFLEHHAGL